MSIRRYIVTLLLGILLLASLGFVFFPISESELQASEISPYSQKSFEVLDEKAVPGSRFFLIRSESGGLYLIHAEKYIFLNRYRILNPITISRSSTLSLDTSNLWNDLHIEVKESTLDVVATRNILKHTWLLFFTFLVVPTVNLIAHINEKKYP